MEKGKIIPIVIAIVLFIGAIIIIISNIVKGKVNYDKIVFAYNNETQEYNDLAIDNVIVINNISFWIVSLDKNDVVLNASVSLKDGNNKETNEFKIEIGKDSTACFDNGSCVLFKLA